MVDVAVGVVLVVRWRWTWWWRWLMCSCRGGVGVVVLAVLVLVLLIVHVSGIQILLHNLSGIFWGGCKIYIQPLYALLCVDPYPGTSST